MTTVLIAGETVQVSSGVEVEQRTWQSDIVLDARASSVPYARLYVKFLLHEWGLDGMAETVELVVSELVTNAVRVSEGMDGKPTVQLWMDADADHACVQVWDANDALPEQRGLDENSESGRGLCIVEAVSEKYGVFVLDGGNGKIVWAKVGL